MKQKIEFILNGADVVRYHTIRTLVTETVGHHSHQVALLTLMLKPEASRELLTAALLHDLAEHITGDLPSPSKRAYGIGEQVSALEDKLLTEAGLSMPSMTPAERRTLKLADIAQGALFCSREIALGNTKLRLVFDRYMSYAHEMILIGVERELFDFIKEQAK